MLICHVFLQVVTSHRLLTYTTLYRLVIAFTTSRSPDDFLNLIAVQYSRMLSDQMKLNSITSHRHLAHTALARFSSISLSWFLCKLFSSNVIRSGRYGRITSRLLVVVYRLHFFVTHLDAYTLTFKI